MQDHRLRADDLARHGWPANIQPACDGGATSVVEAAASLLLAADDAARIRTERFGGA